ncbi:TIGR01777 family oxidoreductase [Sphingobacterium deserti]|uniref:NAD-dependent epimerase/dehydratase n=1 Tax=Sphingobacterium deserti TaxID=1229276 RepID=A0A0B8T2A0_9SPHI|nr:TIGR01777 family oxidoreductase [Sphingobacterium deserti]KGE12943.1 hypothetical protein DI53_3160 [Sphingobacterium deserti]
MQHVLISGGTGFIGKALIDYLLDHYPQVQLTVLVRSMQALKTKDRVHYCLWDVDKNYISEDVPANIDTVIHLAGANIAEKRWTKKRKAVLLRSRTESGALLSRWVQEKGSAVKTFVSASAIGFYGQGDEGQIFTEQDKAGTDFLASVCVAWEASTRPLSRMGIRVVWLRTGLVLHPDGGMWKALKPAFAFRIAPRFASGKQLFSWIGLHDLLALYAFAAEQTGIEGPINAVAPYPSTQIDLSKTLLKKQSPPSFVFPIPEFFLRVALGELAIELIKNAAVSAEKIERHGFKFSASHLSDL